MIKIMMIYDQVQSGQGTKTDTMVPLNATKEVIGPAVMMKPYLKVMDAKVIATLVCGTGTYQKKKDEIKRKFCGMVERLKPDAVVCGPAFNYADYSKMCAEVAKEIESVTGTPAIAAMSDSNRELFEQYQDEITIVKTPNKGEPGLDDALKTICEEIKKRI